MKKLSKLDLGKRKKNRRFVVRERFIAVGMILYSLPYLTYFVTLFASCSYFRFVKSLTVGLAIDKAELRGANIIVDFSK